MAVVQLRDIVTEADRTAVLALRRAPGQGRLLGPGDVAWDDADPQHLLRLDLTNAPTTPQEDR